MSSFRRALPANPDLEQQKKQAKELLRAFMDDDAQAVARVRAELPDKPVIVLADAQFVIAREYGFASWAALRAHIEAQPGDTRSPRERIHGALQRGDVNGIRALLRDHAELRAAINEPLFSFDSTALGHFAGSGNVELIDVLLEFGADPNRRSGWWAGGFHPLHSATGAVAERLMAAGAIPDACGAANLDRADLLARMLAEDPTRVHERGGDGQTPLHFARSRGVIDLLLNAGADPDARDVDHRATPAQWMLQAKRGAGRYDLARYLVERGASADVFLAAALGLTERLRDMIAADPALLDVRTHQGEYGEKPPSSYHIYTWTIGQNRSPLEVARQFGHAEAVQVLLASATPRQRFLLACTAADRAAAQALLASHPDLMQTLGPEDHRRLPEAGWVGDAAAVALMLELGFDASAEGPSRGTVLHCAAWQGALDCVEVVLRHPAGRKLLTKREPSHLATPLGWCCHGSLHCGNPDADYAGVARALLRAGAPPENSDASPAVRGVIDGWPRGI